MELLLLLSLKIITILKQTDIKKYRFVLSIIFQINKSIFIFVKVQVSLVLPTIYIDNVATTASLEHNVKQFIFTKNLTLSWISWAPVCVLIRMMCVIKNNLIFWIYQISKNGCYSHNNLFKCLIIEEFIVNVLVNHMPRFI